MRTCSLFSFPFVLGVFLSSWCLVSSSPLHSKITDRDFDREVLVQFYKETSLSSHWKDSTLWLTAFTDHCSWLGVSCNSQGRVVSLELPNNQLSGSFPSIINLLKELEVLNLTRNQFTGPLESSSFSGIQKLRVLDLSGNYFSSLSICSDVGNNETSLEGLEYLNVSKNLIQEIDGNFGIVRCSQNLKVIDLSSNLLASLPTGLSQLKVLEEVYISMNSKLKLSEDFWNLNNLTTFRFAYGTLSSLPEQVGQFTRLSTLDLTYNQFLSFPSIILELTQMRALSLSNNQIGEISSNFNLFQNLTSFDCRYCSLTSFPTLNITTLDHLDVAQNPLSELDISALTNLQSLIFESKNLIPSSLVNFTSLWKFVVNGEEVTQLPDLPTSIITLMVMNTSVSRWPDSFFSGLPQLTNFDLVYQKAPLEFPYFFFVSSSHFKLLVIDGMITGTLPCSFPRTKMLTLSSTQMGGSLCSEIVASSELQVLQLQSNPMIGGQVPTELMLLSNLEDLLLRENNFEEDLAIEFGEWLDKSSTLESCVFYQTRKTDNSTSNETSVESENGFVCHSGSLLGEEQVCNVQCTNNKTLSGIWMNSDSVCRAAYLGITWTNSKIEIFPNGTGITTVEYYDGCGGSKIATYRLEGNFEIENVTQIGDDEYLMDVSFHLTSQMAFTYSFKGQRWMSIVCLADTPVGKWTDLSHLSCHTTQVGITSEFYDLDRCPMRFDTWYVNFKNSTLVSGLTSWLGIVKSTSTCEGSDWTQPTLRQDVKLRRNWDCSGEDLPSCSAECGDGFAFWNEQCDDGNLVNGDGCSTDCKLEKGWNCPSQGSRSDAQNEQCEPICGDHLIVSSTDCDANSWHQKTQTSQLLWLLVVPGFLGIVGLMSLVFFRSRKGQTIIPPEHIKLENLLGAGQFGEVYKGLWRGNTVVAVKVLKNENLNKEELENFTKEAEVFRNLPPHPNIVQFLGICLALGSDEPKQVDKHSRPSMTSSGRNQQFGIVTEFLAGGNLVEHLRSHYECVSSDWMAEGLDYFVLVDLAKGIAAGMDHLHQNKIVHRDLAARNILIQLSWEKRRGEAVAVQESQIVTERETTKSQEITNQPKIIPKISDFGLAGGNNKQLKISVRWTPPEMLLNARTANEKTDVWSFGVVMYEICVACHFRPYGHLKTHSEVKDFVVGGGQLSFPTSLPVECSSLFKACFSFSQSLRPTFSIIYQQLEVLTRDSSDHEVNDQEREVPLHLDDPFGDSIHYSLHETSTTYQTPESLIK